MSDSNATQVCTKCGIEKPLGEFHKEKKRPRGVRSDCKVCNRAKALSYRADNLEEAQRKDRERSKRKFIEQPEKMRRQAKARYEKNRTVRLEWQSRYYQANREQVLEASQRYGQTHKAQVRVLSNRRRGYKFYAAGTFTLTDVLAKLELQGGLCYYCQKDLSGGFHIEHKIPLAIGGSNWPANICASCISCNTKKKNKTAREFLVEIRASLAAAA